MVDAITTPNAESGRDVTVAGHVRGECRVAVRALQVARWHSLLLAIASTLQPHIRTTPPSRVRAPSALGGYGCLRLSEIGCVG